MHEARLLAMLVDDLAHVGDQQMEHWVRDFDSWDACDQCRSNPFDKTPYALLTFFPRIIGESGLGELR